MTLPRFPLAFLIGALFATGCAGAARMPGAIGMMDDAFPWAPDRLLQWSDFRGRPDMMSAAVALTSYVLSYEAECLGDRFTFRVVSQFLPTRSWVKSAHLQERASDRTLQHERTHFDLSEVQARRARAGLAAIKSPCALSDQARDALLLPFIKDDAGLQQDYDRETVHGTNAARQVEWDAKVQHWLRTPNPPIYQSPAPY